ncbi:MAG: cistern family PEP-CTERM protein [Cyanobacteria bacterium J06635_15]
MTHSTLLAGKLLAGKLAIAIAGLTALTALPMPVLAFDYETQAGETAGNPEGQPLYTVGIDASDIGDSFIVDWLLPAQGDIPDLSATAAITVAEFTDSRIILDVQITNQTTASFQAALMSLGFGLAGVSSIDIVAIDGSTRTFDSVIINGNQNFPGGFKDINVCLFSSNNCSGGAVDNGLQAGEVDSVRLVLTGSFSLETGIVLQSFPMKFQTEAGSFELAGSFEASAETEETEENELSSEVTESIYQAIVSETTVSQSELRVVEYNRATWPNGCLGLGEPDVACTEALVSGYRVVVASEDYAWVYRTNSTGSVLVLDQAATQAYASSSTYSYYRYSETTVSQSSQVSQTTQVSTTQSVFSESVQSAVFQKIVERTQVSASSLRIVEVRRKTWADSCLGLEGDGACAQALTAGYLVTATDGEQIWVYRTDTEGTVVAYDATCTRTRTAQIVARQRTMRVNYTDLSSNYWAYQYIQELTALNIIEGYPDGSFQPDRNITRAELASIIARAFEFAEYRTEIDFTDVTSDFWADQAITTAYRMGFMDTVGDRLFSPLSNLLRTDVMTILAQGLNLTTTSSSEAVLARYKDVNVSSREVLQILTALTEEGIMVNYPDVEELDLDSVATRAEIAVFIYQALVSMGCLEVIESEYVMESSTLVVSETTTTTTTTETSDDGDDDDG